MAAVNSKVSISDYNAVQTKVSTILGTGSTTYGYGQSTASLQITAGTKVSATIWDQLRNDIASISRHQDGSWANTIDINEGDKVRYAADTEPQKSDVRIDALTPTRFNISPSFSAVTVRQTPSRTGIWYTSSTIIFTCTFANADQCRWFFNSGAKIRLATTRSGGTNSLLDTTWTNFLNTAGNQDFGAATTGLKTAYTLTSAYQTYYTVTDSNLYGNTTYTLQAKCNVANNSSATARIVYFKVILQDTNVGQPIDGTLITSLSTIEPAGQPLYGQVTATFLVTPPSVTNGGWTIS